MSAALTTALAPVDNPGQDLTRRTVCIKVQRTRLGNSRKVSAAKVEVDTDKTLLRISKRLFDCDEYKAISNFDAEVSKYLESVCLPFEKGIHLCPLPLLQQVDQTLKEFAARRTALVEAFLTVYPDLCAQAPEPTVLCTIRVIFLPWQKCAKPFRSPGGTSASASRKNCATSRRNSGTRSAAKQPSY
jgi:hypothetical protein